MLTNYREQSELLLTQIEEAEYRNLPDAEILKRELDRLTMERDMTEGHEKSLIRAMLTSEDARHAVMQMLLPDDFHNADMATLFRAIGALVHEQLPISASTFTDYLSRVRYAPASREDTRSFAEVLGWGNTGWAKERITELFNPPSESGEYYATRVLERAIKRQCTVQTQCLQDALKLPDADVTRLLREYEEKITTLNDRLAGESHTSDLVDWFAVEQEAIARRKHADVNGYEEGFRSPLKALNRLLQPLVSGQLVLLAARPKVGKTSFALQMAYHAAGTQGKCVLFASIEMSRQQLAERRLLAATGFSRFAINNLHYRRANAERIYAKLESASEQSMAMPLLVADKPSCTPVELLMAARRAKRHLGGLDLIVVDYLQKMENDGPRLDDTPRVGYVVRSLKKLAKKMNCVVLALVQFGRAAEGKKESRPELHEMRDSGWLEQEADIVLAIHCPDKNNKRRAEIGILKQRDGDEGWVDVGFSPRRTWFFDSEEEIPVEEDR
jgi:replicative DNA helicase